MRTSFYHQPEAQHPQSSAINKTPAEYPIYEVESGIGADMVKQIAVIENAQFTPSGRPGLEQTF
jgi:hypothetical protein